MIGPTLHLNGTTYNALISQCNQALAALHVAREALADAQPNARDYVGRQSDYTAAVDAHLRRLKLLHEMRVEFEETRERIAQQQEGRSR